VVDEAAASNPTHADFETVPADAVMTVCDELVILAHVLDVKAVEVSDEVKPNPAVPAVGAAPGDAAVPPTSAIV
jgi:hypothetical protein